MDGVIGAIDGVDVKELIVHPDDRGSLFEILRCDEVMYRKFGQVYVTSAYPGVIKAWHYHKLQTDYFTCIHGLARLVLFDSRTNSKTHGQVLEFLISPQEPKLVSIPPEVYHGFQCVSKFEAIMLNIPTEPYNPKNPDEYRLDPFSQDVPYIWPR